MTPSIAKSAIDLCDIFRNSYDMRQKIGYVIALSIGLLIMLMQNKEQFIDPFTNVDKSVLEDLRP